MNSDTKLKTLIGVNPADTLYLPIDLTKKDATVIQTYRKDFTTRFLTTRVKFLKSNTRNIANTRNFLSHKLIASVRPGF